MAILEQFYFKIHIFSPANIIDINSAMYKLAIINWLPTSLQSGNDGCDCETVLNITRVWGIFCLSILDYARCKKS